MKARVQVGDISDEIDLPISEKDVVLRSHVKDGRVTGYFTDQTTVPDCQRGIVILHDGRLIFRENTAQQKTLISNYNDCIPPKNLESIVLLIESPHDKEYMVVEGRIVPRSPAQGTQYGKTGWGIERHLEEVLLNIRSELTAVLSPDIQYPLIICNPIQFQASLASLLSLKKINPEIRNMTWVNIWETPRIKDRFVNRLRGYSPVAVLNAATCDKMGIALTIRHRVRECLAEHFRCVLRFTGPHPSSWWSPKNRKFIHVEY